MDYSYVIVDSESKSNLHLQEKMQDFGDFFHSGTAWGPADGFNLILKSLPEIAIINLGDQAAQYFQMVNELHQYLKEIPVCIAVSGTTEQAYNAIKCGFFDYWLLPYNEYELRKTIFRVRKQMPTDLLPQKICLKTYKDYQYLNTEDILYLKADNNSTDFFMSNGNKISAYKTLKAFEASLPKSFIRIHQSYILNTKYVFRINYGKNTCSLRNSNNQLPFSKSYREKIDELKTLLSKNAINTHA
ncbi:MAG: LytTR family DNA-binding domain-containing protein [Bacteroidota bacterium]